ncbi:MAG: hypothetical protein ABI766_05325 [Gemmatimonadales bacterium]
MAAVLAPAVADGQSQPWADVGAAGVVAYESSSVVPGGGSLGEIRVVQPTLMLHAGGGGHFRLMTTVNFEGATIPDGELALGDWGEGFVDRRHPHTWAHEIVLTADDLLGDRDGANRLSLSAGKGFAPFGTDDPMARPFPSLPRQSSSLPDSRTCRGDRRGAEPCDSR